MRSLTGFIVTVVALLLATMIVAEIRAQQNNSLVSRQIWIATQAVSQEAAMHDVLFFDTRTPVHRNRLDMGVWHGSNEVVLREHFNFEQVEFDFLMTTDSHLSFLFNRKIGQGVEIAQASQAELSAQAHSGIRLSRSPLFESMYFTADSSSKYLRKFPFKVNLGEGWQRFKIKFSGDRFSVWLNGALILEREEKFVGKHSIGFRNGPRSVLLDNIVARDTSGVEVVREDFRREPGEFFWAPFGVLVAINLLIAAVVLFRRSRGGNAPVPLYFYTVVTNVMIIGCLGLYFTADYFAFSKLYPKQYWWILLRNHPQGMHAERKNNLSEEKVDESAPVTTSSVVSGKRRVKPLIGFVGSSQTMGLSATVYDDIWVNRVCRTLGADCLNVSEAGITTQGMTERYTERWQGRVPDVTVVNFSNNDWNITLFEANLKELLDFHRKKGIKVLFILEPNDIEVDDSKLVINHAIMRKVAGQYGIPCFDMHRYLRSARIYDSGYLWTDYVHQTSYGQKLFADRIIPEIAKLLRN